MRQKQSRGWHSSKERETKNAILSPSPSSNLESFKSPHLIQNTRIVRHYCELPRLLPPFSLIPTTPAAQPLLAECRSRKRLHGCRISLRRSVPALREDRFNAGGPEDEEHQGDGRSGAAAQPERPSMVSNCCSFYYLFRRFIRVISYPAVSLMLLRVLCSSGSAPRGCPATS